MTNRDSFDCRIPIVELAELQTSHFALRTSDAAFDENLTHYKAEIPQLFWFNAPSQ
jgi:hypothetical protein